MSEHDAVDTRLWHPFADMGAVRGAELVIERGEDVWVHDAAGRRYLDATASLWYANVGHGRREIAAAAMEQMSRLEAYSTFGDLATEPARALAARLAEVAPMPPGARVFLGSGGGDGVDTAAKLARRFFAETGRPERVHLIARTASYHGTHGYGTALAGIPANRAGWGPLVPDVSVVAHDSVEDLREEMERIGPERVAAVFVEPVIGAGGVHPPRDGYIEGVADVCRETGALFVCDSVICGFGRLGTWYGIERWAVQPDLIVFAKGVTSGYLPLGGVIASWRVAEPFWERPGSPVFRHGATYAAHATCCAAALANLDILERENLVERGRDLEDDLLDAVAPLVEHPLVAEVRGGVGLLAAVEIEPWVIEQVPGASVQLANLAREHGVLVRPLVSAIALSPPLTIQTSHFELVADALARALDELSRRLGRAPAPSA